MSSYLLPFYRYFKTVDIIYVCFAIANNDVISDLYTFYIYFQVYPWINSYSYSIEVYMHFNIAKCPPT